MHIKDIKGKGPATSKVTVQYHFSESMQNGAVTLNKARPVISLLTY